jgi:hypothetical protein
MPICGFGSSCGNLRFLLGDFVGVRNLGVGDVTEDLAAARLSKFGSDQGGEDLQQSNAVTGLIDP